MTDNIDYSKIIDPFYRETDIKPIKGFRLGIYDSAHNKKEQKEKKKIAAKYLMKHYKTDIDDLKIDYEYGDYGIKFYYVEFPNPQYKNWKKGE